ncbi:PREDICTED: uncharacterized protein LOC109116485 [Tarenaya hassleriana]|uniref:uncharacterized protein LOC109116485 n=1 Tax=Tarenaya hassleriana TaxID=28532 RepID=UPI0008FD5ED9|nr:PREDICTED: uncharacterized protein LOC109116485 [Tarenaya hassleriana]
MARILTLEDQLGGVRPRALPHPEPARGARGQPLDSITSRVECFIFPVVLCFGTLNDDVYMSQPPGFIDRDKPSFVCKLQKAIYGLKQAPRAWYKELCSFFLATGFINALSDTSLFILLHGDTSIYLLVYVDDIIITRNQPTAIRKYIDMLASRFSLKDLGNLSYFIGVEVTKTKTGILLTQERYITDLLTRHMMQDVKPVSTPMSSTAKLSLHSESKLDDATRYRKVIGSLQYLMLTRSDIVYSVNKLSRYMHCPTTEHWQAAKRILRYLGGTRSHGIHYSRNNVSSLHAYSDADWGGDRDDFSSTGGYIVYLGSHPILWSSKKQKFAVKSSTEAEYKSVSSTASEVQWVTLFYPSLESLFYLFR